MREVPRFSPISAYLNTRLSHEFRLGEGVNLWVYGVGYLNLPDHSLARYLTEEELLYCKNRLNRLAGRFAAKVALMRAVGTGLNWTDINIHPSETGQPVVQIGEESKDIIRNKGFSQYRLSISHDEGIAIGFAAAIPENFQGSLQIGVDVTSNDRFRELMEKSRNRLYAIVFSEREVDDSQEDPQELAIRWASKEAVVKVLETGFKQGVGRKDVEIRPESGNSFSVNLLGKALERAKALSLTDWSILVVPNDSLAIAFVAAHS